MNLITDAMIAGEIKRLAMCRNHDVRCYGPQSLDVRIHRNMCLPLYDDTIWTVRFGELEIGFCERDRRRSMEDFSDAFLIGIVACVVPLSPNPVEAAIDEVVSVIGCIRDAQGYGGLGTNGERQLRNALIEFAKALNSNE